MNARREPPLLTKRRTFRGRHKSMSFISFVHGSNFKAHGRRPFSAGFANGMLWYPSYQEHGATGFLPRLAEGAD